MQQAVQVRVQVPSKVQVSNGLLVQGNYQPVTQERASPP